jgi:hypothetical protein
MGKQKKKVYNKHVSMSTTVLMISTGKTDKQSVIINLCTEQLCMDPYKIQTKRQVDY